MLAIFLKSCISWRVYILLPENWWKPLAVYDAKHLMYTSLLTSEMPSSEPLTMSLFCPSRGSDASQHRRGEFSDVICNISKVHISISKSLSTRVNDLPTLLKVPLWMSAKDYSCPRKGLRSGHAHPAASCSAQRAACLTLVCAARSVAGAVGNLIPWHFRQEESPPRWVGAEKNLHCVACKPWCRRLFGSTERQPAWRQQPWELTFYQCHSQYFVCSKALATRKGKKRKQTEFIETHSQDSYDYTDPVASSTPSPANIYVILSIGQRPLLAFYIEEFTSSSTERWWDRN